MCTVTFIPANDSVFLTSNRDEKKWRKDAHPPTIHEFESGKIIFPKDADAGGTWMACHENGNAIVFLNGGLVAHQPQPPYRKSRGLILLDFIEGATPFQSFLVMNLERIEPFTAVIWDDKHLFECRWDGTLKHHKLLDKKIPHIWSSVTLYDEHVILKRNTWFRHWLQKVTQPGLDDILQFHQFTGDGDPENDLRMNRDGKVATVSVTSLEITSHSASIHYLDLRNETQHSGHLAFNKPLVSRL